MHFRAIAFSVFAVGLLLAQSVAAAPTLHFFSSAAYNANTATMDAALGTTGRLTENFETTGSFMSGLSIVLSGSVATTTETSLPALFDGNAFFPGITDNQFWDGTHTASNAIGNLPNSQTAPTNVANLTTFNYAPGTLSFGIGLSNFQSENAQHELLVNGVSLGTLETLGGAAWASGFVRNAYLRIDSDVPITSVAFHYLFPTTSQQDFLMFDHLTIAPAITSPVPEPREWAAMVAGLAAFGLLARRRAHRGR